MKKRKEFGQTAKLDRCCRANVLVTGACAEKFNL
jgi:hypothetical protein